MAKKKEVSAQKSTKKEAKKTVKKATVTSKLKGLIKKPTKQKEVKEVIDSTDIGEVSKTISRKTKTQEIKDRFDEYRLNNTVLWGEIISVIGEEHIFIQVQFDEHTVLIPDEKFFPTDYSFGARYANMNPEQQRKKRRVSARFRIGGKVPFVVEGIQKIDDRNSKFILEGNRLKALDIIKDRYLGNHSVKIGDEVKANVLAVFENFILVECLGIETRISAYNLTDKNVVDNCMDYISTGDEITVRVKKMKYNPDGTYYLAVSGRLNHGAKNMRDINEGDAYMGYVECYNSQTRIYTIKLTNGVNVSVHEKSVVSRGRLNRGDKVSAVVKMKKEGYCCGTCQKI